VYQIKDQMYSYDELKLHFQIAKDIENRKLFLFIYSFHLLKHMLDIVHAVPAFAAVGILFRLQCVVLLMVVLLS